MSVRRVMGTAAGALVALAAVARAGQAQQGAPRDTTIQRADRTIWLEDAAVERDWNYAQAVVVGNTIHVSGTIARGATMEEQVAGIYARIRRTLERHGATLQDVVKETVYATDMEAMAVGGKAARARAYGTHTPASTWVQIQRLLNRGALVEIEVTAVVPAPRPRGD